MERQALIHEIVKYYGYSEAEAEQIVSYYEKENQDKNLYDFIETKQEISMVIEEDV